MGDRVAAADVLALCFIAFALGHGWMRADGIWVDIAITAGMVLFIGTSAVSLFLTPAQLQKEDHQDGSV